MSKFIVFCENKEHLYDMEWLLEKWFKCSNISSKMWKYRITSNEIIESKKNLEEFKNNNGTCFIEEGRELELRQWCQKQRGKYSQGKLTDEQIRISKFSN